MRSCFRDIVRLNHLKYETYCSSSFASRLSSHPPHIPIFAGFHLVAMSSYNCFCFLKYFATRHSPRRLGTGPLSGEVRGTGLTLFLSLSIPFPFSFPSDDTWFVDKIYACASQRLQASQQWIFSRVDGISPTYIPTDTLGDTECNHPYWTTLLVTVLKVSQITQSAPNERSI